MKKKLTDNQIVFYKSQDGNVHVEVMYAEENIWLNQKAIAELFGADISTVNEHIKNIYKRGELDEDSTIGKFPIVQKEGEREVTRKIKFYSLEAIIAIGYRVNSDRGIERIIRKIWRKLVECTLPNKRLLAIPQKNRDC